MAEKRPDRVRGPAHDAFWDWCGQGELRLPRCADCEHHTWPAAPVCAHCGGARLSWARMSGRGKIVSWCAFERDYYQGALPLPWSTILVELDEGAFFVANPQGLAYQDICFGLPVRLAFLACEDSAGPFKLPVFEPARRAPAPQDLSRKQNPRRSLRLRNNRSVNRPGVAYGLA